MVGLAFDFNDNHVDVVIAVPKEGVADNMAVLMSKGYVDVVIAVPNEGVADDMADDMAIPTKAAAMICTNLCNSKLDRSTSK